MPLSDILDSQKRWARGRWPDHQGPRTPDLESNLILPMTGDVCSQFDQGAGNELGCDGRPGKMQSLRSSSALAYNFFAPWIGRKLGPLAAALGHTAVGDSLSFEVRFPHGLQTIPPNVDVVLDAGEGRPLAVECKFCEPYGSHVTAGSLRATYFENGLRGWADLQLPQCQALAEGLAEAGFRRFDVAQLLKHFLGLANTTGSSPRLVYLWYDTRCDEADEHRAELARFAERIDREIAFNAVTYQEAFAVLRGVNEPIPGYFEYLSTRYFS